MNIFSWNRKNRVPLKNFVSDSESQEVSVKESLATIEDASRRLFFWSQLSNMTSYVIMFSFEGVNYDTSRQKDFLNRYMEQVHISGQEFWEDAKTYLLDEQQHLEKFLSDGNFKDIRVAGVSTIEAFTEFHQCITVLLFECDFQLTQNALDS